MRQFIPLLLAAAAPAADIGPPPNDALRPPRSDLVQTVAGMAGGMARP